MGAGCKGAWPCALEFHVLGGIQGSSLTGCREKQVSGWLVYLVWWLIHPKTLQRFIREMRGTKGKDSMIYGLIREQLALCQSLHYVPEFGPNNSIPRGIYPEEITGQGGRTKLTQNVPCSRALTIKALALLE